MPCKAFFDLASGPPAASACRSGQGRLRWLWNRRLAMLLGACLLSVPSWSVAADLAALRQALRSEQPEVRLSAVAALGRHKDQAAQAVPLLVDLLKDKSSDVRAHALQALGHLGESARPAAAAVIDLLTDPDDTVRRQAVKALGRIRPGPAVTLPLLVKLLEDKDPAVRNRAMDALADAGPEGMERLVEALGNEKIAYWACLVVSEIGPKAEAAVPALAKLLDSPKPELRREAVLALGAIGSAAASAESQLAKKLDDPALATAATFALGRIGKASQDVQTKVEQGVAAADPMRQVVSLWAMARFRAQDKALLQKTSARLVEALKSDNPQLRDAAVRALVDLAPGAEIMDPLLIDFFEQTDPEKVAAAMKLVGQLGRADITRLTKALKHDKLREHAAFLLGELGPKAAAAVPALAEQLKDEHAEHRREAAMALAKIGPGAKLAVPELIRLADKPDSPAAYAACYALGRIGAGAMEAKPALWAAIASGDETLAMIAAWALAQIDPKCTQSAPKSVPVLIRALSEPDPNFRRQAAEALRCLGPLAKDATAALQRAAKDENEQVRTAAGEALRAIQSP